MENKHNTDTLDLIVKIIGVILFIIWVLWQFCLIVDSLSPQHIFDTV